MDLLSAVPAFIFYGRIKKRHCDVGLVSEEKLRVISQRIGQCCHGTGEFCICVLHSLPLSDGVGYVEESAESASANTCLISSKLIEIWG